MMKKKRVTVMDIARKFGVSHGMVSVALTGRKSTIRVGKNYALKS